MRLIRTSTATRSGPRSSRRSSLVGTGPNGVSDVAGVVGHRWPGGGAVDRAEHAGDQDRLPRSGGVAWHRRRRERPPQRQPDRRYREMDQLAASCRCRRAAGAAPGCGRPGAARRRAARWRGTPRRCGPSRPPPGRTRPPRTAPAAAPPSRTDRPGGATAAARRPGTAPRRRPAAPATVDCGPCRRRRHRRASTRPDSSAGSSITAAVIAAPASWAPPARAARSIRASACAAYPHRDGRGQPTADHGEHHAGTAGGADRAHG